MLMPADNCPVRQNFHWVLQPVFVHVLGQLVQLSLRQGVKQGVLAGVFLELQHFPHLVDVGGLGRRLFGAFFGVTHVGVPYCCRRDH